MNVKKKIQGFFSLTRRANAGFTLVELIVVIAILAILAGVAIPVYSGYIKKAELAADQAMLDELNTAFAAACAMNGVNPTQIDATATISSGVADVATGNSEVNADFDELYTPTGVFKSVTALSYNKTVGMFEIAGDVLSFAFGEGTINMTQEQIDKLLDSTFYGDNMTSEALLKQIQSVAGVAGGIGQFEALMDGEDFVNSSLLALGITPGADHAANVQRLNEECLRLAQESLPADASQNDIRLKAQEISDNALVIYTAQKSAGMTAEEAKNILNNVTTGDIVNNVTQGTVEQQQTGVNQAALVYGMYYAYVNSDACTDETIKGNSNITVLDVTAALDTNEEFKNYINSDQGEKDMEAYLAALGVINSGASDPEAVEKLAKEGFASEDLIELLTGAMGK